MARLTQVIEPRLGEFPGFDWPRAFRKLFVHLSCGKAVYIGTREEGQLSLVLIPFGHMIGSGAI